MIRRKEKKKGEQEKRSKSEIIKYILIVIAGWILIAVLWAYQLKKIWTPEFYEKTDFTDEEQETIIEILEEKYGSLGDAQIDYIQYAGGPRETWYRVYISNIDQEIIKEDYKLNGSDYSIDTWDGEEVLAEWYTVDYEVKCYIYETDTGTKAMLYFRGGSELYGIVRD